MIKTAIAGLHLTSQKRPEPNLQELSALAQAANYEVADIFTQNAPKITRATYFGSGKLNEIRDAANAQDIKLLIVNDELSPMQIRNIEKVTGLRVIDRTELILEIFDNRAQTRLAKTQVKIAQLRYELPRLRKDNINYDQQTAGSGGGYTSKGAGETQAELDRRRLLKQISKLKVDLAKQDRIEQSKAPNTNLPQVALVGYTNAGKSTFLNLLATSFNNDKRNPVMAKDMLFATLDTKTQLINLAPHHKILLSDTVGFIDQLPHELVKSFTSTLSHAKDADLLIEVIDRSDPEWLDRMKITEDTLKQIGAAEIPRIQIFNKADQVENLDYPSVSENSITTSLKDPKSLPEIIELINDKLWSDEELVELSLPEKESYRLYQLSKIGDVLKTKISDGNLEALVKISPQKIGPFKEFIIK